MKNKNFNIIISAKDTLNNFINTMVSSWNTSYVLMYCTHLDEVRTCALCTYCQARGMQSYHLLQLFSIFCLYSISTLLKGLVFGLYSTKGAYLYHNLTFKCRLNVR